MYSVYTFGRPSYVLGTFFVMMVIDNLKSFVTLALVYCIVVRRFMHLETNENKYVDPNQEKIPKRENAIPKLKIFCLKFLESTPFETLSLATIAIYTVFLLFWLVHAELLNDSIPDKLMASYDRIFLIIFSVEISLKSFASNMMYLYDKFNLFDAAIVINSMILNFAGISIKGLSVLRLIRVVVIILRKITGN
jgi:hypothetical protein